MGSMRTLFSFVLAGAALFAAVPAVAQTPAGSIAYIDSRRLMTEAPGADQVRQSIDRDMQQFQQQIRVMEDSLRAMVNTLNRQAGTMNAETRQRRELEIEQKRIEFERRAEEMEDDAARRQNELMQPLMNRVNESIRVVRETGRYGLIFDAASGLIVAADPNLDITEQVLQHLRSASPTAAQPRQP
jgi:outer membrane protein